MAAKPDAKLEIKLLEFRKEPASHLPVLKSCCGAFLPLPELGNSSSFLRPCLSGFPNFSLKIAYVLLRSTNEYAGLFYIASLYKEEYQLTLILILVGLKAGIWVEFSVLQFYLLADVLLSWH